MAKAKEGGTVKSTGRRSLRALTLLLLLCAAPAGALELSLEENSGESGTVGYVDIDRVFKEYSGTQDAREAFLGEIKKKEESVNQRKRGVYALKAEIAKLRQERAFALTLPSLLATEEQLNRAAAARTEAAGVADSTSPAAGTPPPDADEPARPEAAQGTGGPAAEPSGTEVSTGAPAAVAPMPAPETLPGMAPAPAAASAVREQPQPAQSAEPARPAPVPLADLPGAPPSPSTCFKFSVSTSVPEIDAAIAAKESELQIKEEELRMYQKQVEKELLEYESRRSEILLGRIYVALKELAVKAGVSVVEDKRKILFGHPAVDLTEELLLALEETK